ncbi:MULTISPECIES: bifunctional DNA primase/polymerase [Microbacterium]|uniref:bifunctional DNA primase/polymerase n=1 Tax=Microbacterium TaxID=33882 RepID=UPI000D64406E|nr:MULTISPECIES: bifunctional DNA primase/polymerase [Microbacterium]
MTDLRVLPLRPGTNIPAVKNWQNIATSDSTQIAEWRQMIPGCNWGIRTGEGVGVLDLDTKNAPEGDPGGFGSLIDIEELLGIDLSNLPLVTTAHGMHLYFRYDGHLASKVPWVPFLDVKADGGHQVAGPGTIREDQEGIERVYTLVRGNLRAIPRAPDALLSAIRGWRVGRPGNGGGSTSPGDDLPSTEEAIKHGLPLRRRNDFMHRLACRWYSKLGLDAHSEVWALARAVWDVTPGHDTFPWSEVETAVASALKHVTEDEYKYRQKLTAWLYGRAAA